MRSMKQRRNNAYHIFVAQTPLVQQPVGDPLEMGLDHRMSMGIALEYIVSRQHRYTVHGITMPSPLALQTQFLPIQTSSKNRVIRGQCGASESLSWWRSQNIPHEKIRCHYPIEKSHPPNIKHVVKMVYNTSYINGPKMSQAFLYMFLSPMRMVHSGIRTSLKRTGRFRTDPLRGWIFHTEGMYCENLPWWLHGYTGYFYGFMDILMDFLWIHR